MAPLANFGPLIHAVTVDKAAIATLSKWLPTYLTATEHREGKPIRFLGRPRTYTNIYDEDDENVFARDRVPVVMVTSSSADDVEVDGDAYQHAWWTVNVTAVIRGRHPGEARYNAALYAATIRDLLTDKQSLDGFANGVTWLPGERVRPVLVKGNVDRTLAAGLGEFRVLVPRVGRAYGGPDEPDADPDTVFDPLPDIQDVTVDVVGEPTTNSEG